MNALSSNSHHASETFSLDEPMKLLQDTCIPAGPTRYLGLCFEDGNLAIVAGESYFLVHRALIARRSPSLEKLIQASLSVPLASGNSCCETIEGRPVLRLEDAEGEVVLLLRAFYDGLPSLLTGLDNFERISTLLRLCSKYEVECLTQELLEILSKRWPCNMSAWDSRNSLSFDPMLGPLNPIMFINLARQTHPVALSLLPAAFYELSTQSPSVVAAGLTYLYDGVRHRLSQEDLIALLGGREHCSRFFSTFIVNELQGRAASQNCHHLIADDLASLSTEDSAETALNNAKKKTCQFAVELAMVELLKDCNGVVKGLTTDPLAAMAEVLELIKRPDSRMHACQACTDELARVVRLARTVFWRSLPHWFALEVPNWR